MLSDYEKGYEQAKIDFKRMIKDNPNIDYVLNYLYYDMAFGLPSFWYKKKNGEEDYKVIWTRYGQGYRKGLEDIELGENYEKIYIRTR